MSEEQPFDFGDLDEIDKILAEANGQVCPEGTPKLSASEAGYLELEGAVKDGDCKIVQVDGGISKDLGCCNGFRYRKGAEKKFSCGTCTYVE